MNCSDVRALLALVDDEARVDAVVLRAHFRDCGFCRAAFPEVFALAQAPAPDVGAAPITPRFSRGPHFSWREAAAAVLLTAALGLGLNAPAGSTSRAASAAHAPRATQVNDQTVAVTHQRWLAGRAVTARFETRRIRLNPAR